MKREQRGATVVEAALIIPILLMFLIAILEFGRAYNEYHVLTNAAREACRYAIAPAAGNNGALPASTAVQQVATDWLNSAGISPSSPPNVSTVSCGTFSNPITGTAQPLNCTAVTVTVPFSFLAPQLLFGNAGPSIAMTSTATMRQETNN